MKAKVYSLFKHPLISGSIVIFLGTFLANILNFVFNWYMVGSLSSADYGELATFVSLITLPSLAANAIVPLVVHFSGSYFANNEIHKVRGLYSVIGKFFFFVSLIIFILFVLFIKQIGAFFHIDKYFLLVLTDIVIFTSFFNVINTAFLQARLSFNYIAFLSLMTAFLKTLFGMLFVLAGFALHGAFSGIFISFIIPFLLTFIPLRFLFKKQQAKPEVDVKELFSYGIPSALSLLGSSAFIITDILLVKHFFPPDAAGFYAAISLVGRVIFYFTAPISVVMFPLIVQKRSKNESYSSILFLSLSLVIAPSLILVFLYFFFPDFVLSIFRIDKTSFFTPMLLGVFGLFITVYSLLSIMTNFYLSIKKTNICIPIVLCALAQIILIWFYHGTFMIVVLISFATTFLLLLSLLLYYPYATKKK